MSKARALKPPKKRCEKCRYWQRIELDINEGECVRFPPVFVGLDHEGMPTFEQPYTPIYSACGEFAKEDGSFQWR